MDNDNMPKLRLGKWNKLEVVKEVDFGMYLGAENLARYFFLRDMCLKIAK